MAAAALPPAEGVKKITRLRQSSTDKLRFGLVKIVADGSIQGFSARLRWPGLLQWCPQRDVVRFSCRTAHLDRCVPSGRRSYTYPHQRRSGLRGRH